MDRPTSLILFQCASTVEQLPVAPVVTYHAHYLSAQFSGADWKLMRCFQVAVWLVERSGSDRDSLDAVIWIGWEQVSGVGSVLPAPFLSQAQKGEEGRAWLNCPHHQQA